ncbi:hypothetical protein GJAV_G00121400 [Gymnothorax javanicus]|nr:hypothetical protein GJAV_G00121400 [Gymnothorax javanicus]
MAMVTSIPCSNWRKPRGLSRGKEALWPLPTGLSNMPVKPALFPRASLPLRINLEELNGTLEGSRKDSSLSSLKRFVR